MALILEKEYKYGLNVTYWMITNIYIDKAINVSRVTISSYVSKARRLIDIKEVCSTKIIDISGIDHNFTYLYEQIKLNSYFINAIDDV